VIELGSKARELVDRFPKGDPQRIALEKIALAVENWLVKNVQEIVAPAVEAKVDLDPNLQKEWERQAKKLAGLFADDFGFSQEEYIASLPQFEPQPKTFKGRFFIPLIVETRISLVSMAQRADLNYHGYSVSDWNGDQFKDPKNPKTPFYTPKTPYTTWMQHGRKNLGMSAEKFRSHHDPDERGATEYEGIALYLAKPDVFKSHGIYFPGSQVAGSRVSSISFVINSAGTSPILSSYDPENGHYHDGPASCGRKINKFVVDAIK